MAGLVGFLPVVLVVDAYLADPNARVLFFEAYFPQSHGHRGLYREVPVIEGYDGCRVSGAPGIAECRVRGAFETVEYLETTHQRAVVVRHEAPDVEQTDLMAGLAERLVLDLSSHAHDVGNWSSPASVIRRSVGISFGALLVALRLTTGWARPRAHDCC
jgi:hypothetical protein